MDPAQDAPAAQVEGDAATAPAPAVEASALPEAPTKKTGFLASLVAGPKIAEIQGQLTAEKAAHAATLKRAEAAEAKVAEYVALEAQLQLQVEEATKAATQAKEKAEAEVAPKVSQKVAATVESLGVPEAQLPESQPEPAGKGQDFNHLKGVDRAAAAFNAQLAAR